MFKKWILDGLSVSVINDFKNIPERTLFRHFHKFLDNPPSPNPPKHPKSIWLKVDAKYFGKRGSKYSFCVFLFKEGTNLIYWRFAKYETFEGYVSDFVLLNHWGYTILGVTSDWHKSIVSAVKYLFKDNIPHQRCLVHTQRYVKNKLTKNPKTKSASELLEIAYQLNYINNRYDMRIWILWFERWKTRYEHLTKKRTYATDENSKKKWWYTHKNLRISYRTILTTLDHMFLYLDYEKLDKHTNGIESEFSHLAEKINTHRGLTLKHKISSIGWYIHFKAQERAKKS